MFSEEERRALVELGLPLSGSLEEQALEEQFLAYQAASSPSEKLFGLLAHRFPGRKPAPPRRLWRKSKRFSLISKSKPLPAMPPEQEAGAAQAAFSLLARKWNSGGPVSGALRTLLSERPEYAGRMQALQRAVDQSPMAFQNAENAQALFSGRNLSATQIETYHLCRFQYFCRYGMNAKERRPAELGAIEYGSLMHFFAGTGFPQVQGRGSGGLFSNRAVPAGAGPY